MIIIFASLGIIFLGAMSSVVVENNSENVLQATQKNNKDCSTTCDCLNCTQGENFVDEDGDGVCDNKGTCYGKGHHGNCQN